MSNSRWEAEKSRFDDQPVDPDTYGPFLANGGSALNNIANVFDAVPDIVQDQFSSRPPRYEVREATFPIIPQTMATAGNAIRGVFHRPISAVGDALSLPGKFAQDMARVIGA